MNVIEIRSAWFDAWRHAAKEDDGAWICSMFGASTDELEKITDDMLAIMSKIPVEESSDEDDDFDINFLLHWQTYGIDVNENELAALYFEGQRRAVIFAQIDAISDLPLKAFIDASAAKTLAIELPPSLQDPEEMKDAIEFFEDGLGLEADVFEESSHLPWNGDDTKVVLRLNKAWMWEAMEEASSGDVERDRS